VILSLRFAARELRSGVRGFRIFLACLALGVAAIAAAGSTAEAFRQGLAAQARTILGGDVAVSSERAFQPRERDQFARLGQVSYAVGARAMAESPTGDRRMVELRGVDDLYPLSGEVDLTGADGRPVSVREALAGAGDAPPAAVEQGLLDRTGLRLGDRFKIGNAAFTATAVLVSEPDRLTRGFSLGPRVLVRRAAFEAAGYIGGPGFGGETARLALRPGLEPRTAIAALRKALPKSALQMRDRADVAPGVRRLIDQLEYFLGFIGLASLVAGGLGVAGAVSAYLESRKPSIAVLKALGASAALVRNLYFLQIMALTCLGVAIGLAAGAAAPFALGAVAGKDLPAPALFALYPAPLERAAAFGLLAALAFALGPLARARSTPPSALFRRELSGRIGAGPELFIALAAAAGLAALAVLTAPTRLAAGVMIGGVVAAFAVLWLLGLAAAWLGGRLRGLASGPVRVGLANLAGPRSAARTAAPSIGLGVALLTAVVLIQSSLLHEIRSVAPRTAPALVMTDIPGDRTAAFDALCAQILGPLARDRYLRMPFATGRITAIHGAPVVRSKIERSQRWAYDHDIAISAIGGEPVGADIEAGRWWPATYAGPPLAAMEAEAAEAGGLKLGDPITVSILGRDIEARIAVLRKVNFGGFGPAFGLILDAHALDGANLTNVAIAKATPAQEGRMIRALAAPFGQVNVISVREQLQAASGMFDRLALAVRGAAAVAALAGLLVLAGAIAAGARARAREAATLKVLGASRGQILSAYAVEYGAVGLISGLAGAGLGYAAAWPVVVHVFHVPWAVDWGGLFVLVVGSAALAAGGGLVAAGFALAQRPAPVLRAD
jgi:putative ABC transport system permease protein